MRRMTRFPKSTKQWDNTHGWRIAFKREVDKPAEHVAQYVPESMVHPSTLTSPVILSLYVASRPKALSTSWGSAPRASRASAKWPQNIAK